MECKVFFAMHLGTAYIVPVKVPDRVGQPTGCSSLFNILIWFWVFAAVAAMKPLETQAAKNKAVRKEASKENAARASNPTAPKITHNRPPNPYLRQRENTSLDPLEKREHVVRRIRAGDTLPGLFARFGLGQSERQMWVRSIQRNFSRQTLPAGREVHFYFSTENARGRRLQSEWLKALEVDYDDTTSLTWEKSGREIFFQKREKPYDVELKAASVMVDHSLFEDGRSAGLQPTLLSQLADIFTWDMDLEKVRQGDSVKILYEKRSRKGQETKASLRILAAELINAGQKFTAIYFEKQKGIGGYYNLEGRSLARAFLRFPLEFINISSQFTDSRFHPILKANLPHLGVDFAAQRGTPVRAVGDGVIRQAGRNGGYGKLVEIQHDSTYMSRYAHLDRFAAGIRNGVEVKKGQVIGYVGSTGRSTGPHLHFELYKDRQYIDPLSVDFPADDGIEPSLQKVFDHQKNLFLVELSSGPQS